MILERDALLHKRYRIVDNLGQGGMGSIYRAVDENLGVDVAVKENLFTTEEYARQFRLEAVILANLRHPNLPRVSDHFVIAGEGQYLIMDFIEGEDLRQRMERVGVIPEDEVIQVGAAICDALNYLHGRKPPILHRDIKPGNVKIAPDGHIYLVDFGLAKVIQGNQATTTGARAMTPGYSPPEQYGTARTDVRTDIYSLGATLYAALTGIIPEDGLARAMDNAQLTPLRKRNPDVSRRVAAAIEKAMEVDPSDRYQTAETFKTALLSAKSKTQQLTGTYSVSPPPPEGERKSDPVKAAGVFPQTDSAEDQPFVSPKKKQRERQNRMLRIIFGVLTVLLVAGFFAFGFLFPGSMPASVHAMFPFFPVVANAPVENTPTQELVITVLPSATTIPVQTSTPFDVSPFQTQTAAAMLTQTLAPTPIGADYLEIAYASTRTGVAQIYLTGLLGDLARPITDMPGGACEPSWSPDGQKLVFTSPCKIKKDTYPESSLYIVNVDGTGLTPLPSAPGGDFEPEWSPDGKYIAFTSLRDGYMQIYLYDVQKGTSSRLVKTDLNLAARQPSWSSDSKQIVYAYQRVTTYELWTISLQTKKAKQIYLSGDQLSNQYPVWSPDGNYVIFSQRNISDFNFPSMYSLSLNTNNAPQKISLGVLSVEDMSYSPGAVWLAYEGGGDRGYHVYYSTPSGGNQSRITQDVTFDDFDPAWRPTQITK